MKIAVACPYLCQYDNVLYPGGSCNMTSLGMVLDAHKCHVAGPHSRTPDNLLQYCDDNGLDRHSLDVIAQVSRHFGLGDEASYHGNFEQLKAHLRAGGLAIVQGTFTASGHVIVVRGFDPDAGTWLCNDPAGHYPHYSNPGWESGEGVSYPSEWFRAHAAPDGLIWLHLLHK